MKSSEPQTETIAALRARVADLEAAAMPYYRLAVASLKINGNENNKDSNPVYEINGVRVTLGDSRRIIETITDTEPLQLKQSDNAALVEKYAPYYRAVIDQCASHHLPECDNPYDTIGNLCSWNSEAALDPRISAPAAALHFEIKKLKTTVSLQERLIRSAIGRIENGETALAVDTLQKAFTDKEAI